MLLVLSFLIPDAAAVQADAAAVQAPPAAAAAV